MFFLAEISRFVSGAYDIRRGGTTRVSWYLVITEELEAGISRDPADLSR